MRRMREAGGWLDVRYHEVVVVRVKLFSLVFVRTHRLASEEGRQGGLHGQKERVERREEEKREKERAREREKERKADKGGGGGGGER